MSVSWIVRPPPRLISGVGQAREALSALPSTRTDWREPAISARPPAASVLTARSAWLTWLAVTPERLHPRRIEDHADLAVDAAGAADRGHALDRQQPA